MCAAVLPGSLRRVPLSIGGWPCPNAAFGFVERTRIGESHRAQLAVGDDGAVIMADVGGERRAPESDGLTHVVRVRVVDVDDAFARAHDHGALPVAQEQVIRAVIAGIRTPPSAWS